MGVSGRPTLPLGQHGDIRVYEIDTGGYLARAYVRDYDGRRREVKRVGKSKAAAKQSLQAALKDRFVGQMQTLKPETRLRDAAQIWFAVYEDSGEASPRTCRLYRRTLDNHIVPALGDLRLHELTTGVISAHVQAINKRSQATAKLVRTILSNVIKHAIQDGALNRNPVSDIKSIKGVRKDVVAFDIETLSDLRRKYHADPRAHEQDIVDLLDFLLATGVRLSEACAVGWEDIDFDNGTVHVGVKMLQWEKERGWYVRTERSSKLSERDLELPNWAMTMLRNRKAVVTTDVVFPAPKGTLRDISNTSRAIKKAFKKAGYESITSKIFRTSVVTLVLDDQGIRAASGQAGHTNTITTQAHYVKRNSKPVGAKKLLERVASVEAVGPLETAD